MTPESMLRLPIQSRQLPHGVGLAFLPAAVRVAVVELASLLAATVAVAAIEDVFHASYAAPVYLLAVLVVARVCGTVPAVVASIAAFLLYDFLFVQPLYTFTIASPDEWLNLVVLLVVSVVVGRLVALLARRAEDAAEQAREAQTLFRISGALAAGGTVAEVGDVVLARLAEATGMERAWLGLGPSPGEERTMADTASGLPLPLPTRQVVLVRAPSGEPDRWLRTHQASMGDRLPRPRGSSVHRVRIELAGEALGSIWTLRSRSTGDPDRAETLILAAAADQIAQAVVRDRLSLEHTNAEVARRSEALKTALLDAVSHDLRTPLATIRAAAGSLLDRAVTWSPDEQSATLRTIDAQAERMNRLVRNLLDLSRIEGGGLRPELEAHDLEEIVERAVHIAQASTSRRVEQAIAADLPPVLVDDVYLGQILLNLLENAARYGGDCIRVSAVARPDAPVELVIEDNGQGVPASSLPRLFEKFYRAPATEQSRAGMGIGLTVVAGLARAMGGDVAARPSSLGGLAVSVSLQTAPGSPTLESRT